jgi:hypothetical protein
MTDPSSPSPKILYPEWPPEYQAALLELDPKQLMERVNTPGTMFPKFKLLAERVVTEDFRRRLPGESDDSGGVLTRRSTHPHHRS